MKLVRITRVTTLALLAMLVASGASAETLTSALASAYTNNPDILAANVSAQAASEGIVIKKAGKMPQLALSGGITGTTTNAAGSTTNSLSSNIGLGYSQTLFDNGVTDAKVEGARADAEAAIEQARSTEQTVLLSAAQAYYNVALNTQIVLLRQDSVSYYQAQVQAATDRLNVGEGTSTEVSQAQAQLAQALADKQSAASDLATAEANYVRYVGHMPKNVSLDFPFENKLPTSLDQARALAEANHPGLRAALAQIRSAKASADAAEAAFGPSVTTTGSLGYSTDYIKDFGAASASVGLKFTVPLYYGGTLGAAARSSNLLQIKAEMSAQAAHELINAQIAQAWSGLRTSAATIAAVKAAELATKKVLDAVSEEFGVGQKTQLDVLNAKSNLTTVQITKVRAEAGRLSAAVALLSSIGRMSAADLGLPVEIRTPDTYRAKVEDIWQELRAVPN